MAQFETLKAKLAADRSVVGLNVVTADPGGVELLGLHGWDFVLLDVEHGEIDRSNCENLIRAAELTGMSAIARLPSADPTGIGRFLDAGAHGCQIAWVESADEAAAAVAAAKYPPLGHRGFGAGRSSGYGTIPPAEFVARHNADGLVSVQIEGSAGARAAREVAAVAGVDVVFIGSSDLAGALGFPGEPMHPSVREVVDQIASAVLESGKTLGVVAYSPEDAASWRERGARFVVTTTERAFGDTARTFLSRAR
jgi:4-hydroxy-2-oxoheptanedioate aldolase